MASEFRSRPLAGVGAREGVIPGASRKPSALSPPALILLLAVGLAALAVGIVVLRVAREGSSAPPRAITVVAQDGRFDGTNPPLELRVGEKVALTIVNREAAVVHDFAIGGLKVRTSYLRPGASETVVFTPARPGVYRYTCTLHPGMMDGQVIVREPER